MKPQTSGLLAGKLALLSEDLRAIVPRGGIQQN
jgi:hypothetical protein